MFEGLFHLYVRNSEELTQLMSRVEVLPNVYKVTRYDNQEQEES